MTAIDLYQCVQKHKFIPEIRKNDNLSELSLTVLNKIRNRARDNYYSLILDIVPYTPDKIFEITRLLGVLNYTVFLYDFGNSKLMFISWNFFSDENN